MWAEAEVLDGLTRVLRAAQKDDVGASWRAHGELIEGEAFAAGLLNAGTSGRSEAQSADGHLRHLIEAVVVRDRAYNCTNLALVCLARVLVRSHGSDLGEGDGRLVDPGHAEATEDGLVELRIGTAGEEAVQAVQETQVGVLAFRRRAVAATDVVIIQIN